MMDYKDFSLNIELLPGASEIALQIRLFHDKVYVGYNFGTYNHSLSMYSNGVCNEVIDRNEKVLSQQQYPLTESIQFSPMLNKYGKIYGAVKSDFVIGAGNGIFGMGITKAERSNDSYMLLGATDKSYFLLQVIVNQTEHLLCTALNAKTLESEDPV
jgi:hypothetical protein